MVKRTWKGRIVKNCKSLGIYKPEFDAIYDRLAEAHEKRDLLDKEWRAGGMQMTVQHTNKGGATNVVENPLLSSIRKTGEEIRSLEKEIGLTPISYKDMGTSNQGQKSNNVQRLLNALEDD